jgi:Ni/Co efflux regulator RcnB
MKRILAGALALTMIGGVGAASAQDHGHGGRGGHSNGGAAHAQGHGFSGRSAGHSFAAGPNRGFAGARGFAGNRSAAFAGRSYAGHSYGYRGYRSGFRQQWRRGGFWPRGYGVFISDPWDYNLYDAPYGYRWVRDEYGELVLISIATGLIADVIDNGGY